MTEELTYEEARDYCFRSLAACSQTEEQLHRKLLRKGCSEEINNRVMHLLKAYGFVDDTRFMEEYVATHCHRMNRKQIADRFYAKGLRDMDLLDRLLEENSYDEMQILDREVRKYVKTHKLRADLDEAIYRQKLLAHFARKGYSYSRISDCYARLQSETEAEN